jgi:hypothetical protein
MNVYDIYHPPTNRMLTALVATTYTLRERRESKQQTEVCAGLSRVELIVFLSVLLILILLFFSIPDS